MDGMMLRSTLEQGGPFFSLTRCLQARANYAGLLVNQTNPSAGEAFIALFLHLYISTCGVSAPFQMVF